MDPTTPTRLTDYTNYDIEVRQVASGGFGVVYMGPCRLHDDEWIALKTLKPEVLARSKRANDLFVREGLTWVGLWPHANLLTARGVTMINSQPFLVLDYARYGSLRNQYIAHRQRSSWFTARESLELAQQIAAGLVALHTPDPAFLRPQPIVHRDLKPENVLCDEDGYAMITDFGLAKVAELAGEENSTLLDSTRTLRASDKLNISEAEFIEAKYATHSRHYQTARGVAMGTLSYMAPEQWDDAASAGPPADVYAFGIILAELLTGNHPLLDLRTPHRQAEWRLAHQEGQPRSLAGLLAIASFLSTQQSTDRLALLSLVADIEGIYQACLAKQSEARPTAAKVLARLQQAARQQLGENPYTPPEVTPHTADQERIQWHNLAITYDNFGLYAEALLRNDRALALAPTDPDVLSERGNLLAELGRREEALTVYAQTLAVLPPEDTQRRKGVLNNLGNRFRELGRFAEAEVLYEQTIDLMPDNAVSWYNRADNQRAWAIAEMQAGNMEATVAHVLAGIEYAEQAVALNPHDSTYRLLLDGLLGSLLIDEG